MAEKTPNTGSQKNGKCVKCDKPIADCKDNCGKCNKIRKNCVCGEGKFMANKDGGQHQTDNKQENKPKAPPPKNLFDVSIEHRDVEFENVNITDAYNSVRQEMSDIQKHIYSFDIEAAIGKSDSGIKKEYDSLLQTKAALDKSLEAFDINMASALTQMTNANKVLSKRKDSMDQIYTKLEKVSKAIENYIALANEENNRLRTLNVVQSSNIHTTEGKKCISAPYYDPIKGAVMCNVDVKKKQKIGTWLGFGGTLTETDTYESEAVSQEEFNKYNKYKDNYNRMYKYAGLESSQLFRTSENLPHFDMNKQYIIISPGVMFKSKVKDSADMVSFQLPVGARVSVVASVNLGTGSAYSPDTKVKVKVSKKNINKIEKLLADYNINQETFYSASFDVKAANLGELLNLDI